VPKTPPYPEEFRREAVRLLRRGDRTVPELARDLGCSPQSLRNWSRQVDLDEGRRSDGLTSDEREELKRLRRENRILVEEREILKKAAAFFAAQDDRTRR
jgi:transposase